MARRLELSGPNVTVSSRGQAGECAFLHAASLLRHGQADQVIVIAGDTLTRTAYEWYEVAGLGFIPSEAVTAMVLEHESARPMRSGGLRQVPFPHRFTPVRTPPCVQPRIHVCSKVS